MRKLTVFLNLELLFCEEINMAILYVFYLNVLGVLKRYHLCVLLSVCARLQLEVITDIAI